MKRIVMCAVVGAMLALLPAPKPADAQSLFQECVNKGVTQCDKWFSGESIFMEAARGWCYMAIVDACYEAYRKPY